MVTLRRVLRRSLVVSLAAAAATVAAPAASASAAGCDKVASPTGSDRAAGTEAAPYGSFEKLANSLAPGQVGCLRGGRYSEDATVDSGGSGESARTVVRSYP